MIRGLSDFSECQRSWRHEASPPGSCRGLSAMRWPSSKIALLTLLPLTVMLAWTWRAMLPPENFSTVGREPSVFVHCLSQPADVGISLRQGRRGQVRDLSCYVSQICPRASQSARKGYSSNMTVPDRLWTADRGSSLAERVVGWQ